MLIAIGVPVAEVRRAWSRQYQAEKRRERKRVRNMSLPEFIGYIQARIAKNLGIPMEWIDARKNNQPRIIT